MFSECVSMDGEKGQNARAFSTNVDPHYYLLLTAAVASYLVSEKKKQHQQQHQQQQQLRIVFAP